MNEINTKILKYPEDIKNYILDKLEKNKFLKYASWDNESDGRHVNPLSSVMEEMQYYINDTWVSPLFISQLDELNRKQFVTVIGKKHPFRSRDIFLKMKEVINGEIIGKPFLKKNSKLYGLGISHIHHNENFYLEDNHIRFIKRMFPDEESVLRRLEEIKLQNPTENELHTFFYETLINSINWKEKTGEWIVYQRKDEKVRFLCLYVHDQEDKNDEILFREIERFLI